VSTGIGRGVFRLTSDSDRVLAEAVLMDTPKPLGFLIGFDFGNGERYIAPPSGTSSQPCPRSIDSCVKSTVFRDAATVETERNNEQ